MSKINVEWKGNVYIELYPFNQKIYDFCLVTDPTDPNYVGDFKEVQKKFYEYLQAKGRGENVKSPITINNLKSGSEFTRTIFINSFHPKDIVLPYDSKNYATMSIDADIELKSGKFEGKLTYDSPISIKNQILNELMYNDSSAFKIIPTGKTSGSFEYDRYINVESVNKQLKELDSFLFDCYSVYLEPSETSEIIFGEIRDENENCLQSFTFKPEESFLSYDQIKSIPSIFSSIRPHSITEEIINQLNAYIKDKDIDEFKQEQEYEREYGNFYKPIMETCSELCMDPFNDTILAINRDPIFKYEINANACFKSKNINQATYYRYCNPDKISFKDFKDNASHNGIALCNLNKKAQEEAKNVFINSKTLFCCLQDPFIFSLSTNPSFTINDKSFLGRKNSETMINQLIDSDKASTSSTIDMTDNLKHYFDEDFEVFNLKDYGNEISGSFIYRNLEFEFDYNPSTEELNLFRFNYDVEDNKTGYYEELIVPPFLENKYVKNMLIDQIDLQVNNFIAENRYGSLDEMLKAAEEKSSKSISSRSEKSKDDLEL